MSLLTRGFKKGPDSLAFFCLFYLIVFLITSCSKNQQVITISGPTMGTTYSIKAVVREGLVDQDQLERDVSEALVQFNDTMSTYLDDSELSKINQGPHEQWLPISDDLERVIGISAEVYEQSGGAFDITVGPLVNLWGFGPIEVTALPTQDQINAMLDTIGFDKVQLKDGKIKKAQSIYLDLSSVAKGYSTDVIADLLGARGVTDYMVEVGGEIKLKGLNSRGKPWTIGIEKPALGREGAMMGVRGDNIAIATSGEYRNYYERDGVRVSHTIDPVVGKPIKHQLASVTVVTSRGGYADAWATALNVLGAEKALALAEELGLAAFLIIKVDEGFETQHSSAFEQYMVKL